MFVGKASATFSNFDDNLKASFETLDSTAPCVLTEGLMHLVSFAVHRTIYGNA